MYEGIYQDNLDHLDPNVNFIAMAISFLIFSLKVVNVLVPMVAGVNFLFFLLIDGMQCVFVDF